MQLKEEPKATGKNYKRKRIADPVFGLRKYVRMDYPVQFFPSLDAIHSR
jgi:hypothetical protein